ncbi:MAG: PqqD family protein [Bacteroidales bacterium]|nr:PqqD family protein [Bacteroidales bacterium]
MKQKAGFKLRQICGENIITAEGINHVNFNKLMVLNPSAAFLWSHVEGEDFDNARLAALLTEEYGIDGDTALHDAEAIAKQWLEAGLVEE